MSVLAIQSFMQRERITSVTNWPTSSTASRMTKSPLLKTRRIIDQRRDEIGCKPQKTQIDTESRKGILTIAPECL